MTNNLNVSQMTAAQASKSVTHNDANAELDAAMTDIIEVAVSTTTPITLTQAQATRAIVIRLVDDASPPVAPFTIRFPAGVNRGLVVIDNDTGYTATIEIASQVPTAPTVTTLTESLVLVTTAYVSAQGSAGGASAFIGLSDAPAAYTSQGLKNVRVNTGETALEFSSPVYDIGGTFGGSPTASQIVLGFVASRALIFPTNLAGSQFIAKTAATASTAFDLQKNGSSVGTLTFAIAGTSATFVVTTFTMAAGDRLEVVGPGTPDTTLAELLMNFVATRGD